MNKGFIALMLSLTVSGFLLALVAVSSIQSFTFFDMALRKQYRYMNYFNAGNCLDQATLWIANDFFLVIDTPKSIPHLNCSIIKIEKRGSYRDIYARGNYEHAYIFRNATILVTPQDIEVIEVE